MYALPLPTEAFELGGPVAFVSLRNIGQQGATLGFGGLDRTVTVFRGPDGGLPNASVLPRAGMATMQRALADLRKFRRFATNPDGKSFDLAEKFLGLIVNNPKPFHASAQVFASGTAVLNLRSYDVSAQLEFLGDGTIVANVDTDREWDADVEGFEGTSIPIELAEQLGMASRL